MHDQMICIIPGLRCTPNSILMWVITLGKSQEFDCSLLNRVNTGFIENRMQRYYSDPDTMCRISSTSYWGGEKKTAMFRVTFSIQFSCMKIGIVWFQLIRFGTNGSNWNKAGIGWDNGLVPSRRQVIFWVNVGIGNCRIFTFLSLDG